MKKSIWRRASKSLSWPIGSRLLKVRRAQGDIILTFDDETEVKMAIYHRDVGAPSIHVKFKNNWW